MHWTAADPRRLISRCISRSNCMTWRRSGHEWWVMWSTMIRVDLTGTRLQEMMISSWHDLLGYCISFKLSLISGLREKIGYSKRWIGDGILWVKKHYLGRVLCWLRMGQWDSYAFMHSLTWWWIWQADISTNICFCTFHPGTLIRFVIKWRFAASISSIWNLFFQLGEPHGKAENPKN